MIRVRVNEVEREIPEETRVGALAQALKPGADVVVRNGFPAPLDAVLTPGDELVLIRRGEVPLPEELEALLVARHTPGVHVRVKTTRVGIAGVGGLGSQVAIALARTGFGGLVLADFDVVEPSNLNRQQYFMDQLGLPKVDALAATLRRINPYVTVETHRLRLTASDVPRVFQGCQVVVEAFDRADEKAMLVETVLRTLPDAWVVAASGLAGHGPAETVRTHRLGARLFVVGDLESAAQPGTGLMAPRVGVAAHAQANLVLRLALGEED